MECDDQPDVVPLEFLETITNFKNLRSLQLNGMMRSYQPLIWLTCWLNPFLTHLHLEMALEPELWKETLLVYRKIDETWTNTSRQDTSSNWLEETEYLGAHGFGVLHEEFGVGEYLDQHSIRLARHEAAKGCHGYYRDLPRFLSICRITLMNFVVDSGPFARWFNPTRLSEIVFLSGCIDAGFVLPPIMKRHVRISPKFTPNPRVVQFIRPSQRLQIVEIIPRSKCKGDATRMENIIPSSLKNKLSQILPRWGPKGRETEE